MDAAQRIDIKSGNVVIQIAVVADIDGNEVAITGRRRQQGIDGRCLGAGRRLAALALGPGAGPGSRCRDDVITMPSSAEAPAASPAATRSSFAARARFHTADLSCSGGSKRLRLGVSPAMPGSVIHCWFGRTIHSRSLDPQEKVGIRISGFAKFDTDGRRTLAEGGIESFRYHVRFGIGGMIGQGGGDTTKREIDGGTGDGRHKGAAGDRGCWHQLMLPALLVTAVASITSAWPTGVSNWPGDKARGSRRYRNPAGCQRGTRSFHH